MRYRYSTISRIIDIEAWNFNIDAIRYRRSVDIDTNIEDFSISTNAPAISVYDIEAFVLRYRISCSSISVFCCRIQPELPKQYWKQIAVCTMHILWINHRPWPRGSCAARAALSRRSGGCTRRRGRTRCTGRSTGRSPAAAGAALGPARLPEQRPQPPERASTEGRSVWFFKTRIDWRQVWNDDLDAHQWKLPGSPADQNNVEYQRRKISFSNINEEKQSKQCCDRRTSSRTYAVGHPQRRMIVYYDRYVWFQQIPCGQFSREGLPGAKFGLFWSENFGLASAEAAWVSCRPRQCRTSTKL